ncbi:MAG: c-type cytochrome biogenesis protein CcmI, partial [Pseudomonadota bacterium]
MTFWILAGALVLAGAAFFLWPLWRSGGRGAAPSDRRSLMRALYRDRVAELDAEAAAGQVDGAVRDQVEEELGANLLEELEAGTARDRAAAPAGGGGRAVWVAALLVPVLAGAVYLSAGEPTALQVAGAEEVLQLDPRSDRLELEAWARRLERRVSRHADDTQSWYLLGISRLQLGEFDAAVDALSTAHGQVGHDPNIAVYLIQARYLARDGELDERSRALGEALLEQQPNHPLVLEMFAIDAFRNARYRQAVEYLTRALDAPLSEAQRESLRNGLAAARERLGDDAEVEVPPPESATGTADAGPRFDVAVPAPAGG